MQRFKSVIAIAVITLGAVASAHATNFRPLVRFDGAIGTDPLTASGTADVLNVVRGVNPAGRAWTVRKFSATIRKDGAISARGNGLLLASGDVIGTRAGVAQVVATLFCGAANGAAAAFTSPPGAMDTAGNFHISGTLSQDGLNPAVLPAICDNPALLIRAVGANGVAGTWLAAGIVEIDD
jgi:hypothetical protein